MENKNIKVQVEKVFFYLLVLSGLIPLIFTKYYLTLDGPAHLYNANIIRELILDRHEEFQNLFVFNNLPVPNWLSHFLFATLRFIFPDYLTEKIVLGAYLILTPVFFRKITLYFAPGNKLLSYLMIPFAHNHLLYLGSYNLIFAVTLLLITINYVLRRQENFSMKVLLTLGLLLLSIYFSHMLIFMLSVSVIFLLPLDVLKTHRQNGSLAVDNTPMFFRNLIKMTFAVLPSLFLAINYMLRVDSLEKASRMDLKPLLDMLINVRPLITLAYNYPWLTFTKLMFILFVVLLYGNFIITIRQNIKKTINGYVFQLPQPHFSWIWLLFAMVFLILYLIVPNANVLPERLIFIVFLFLILGLSILKYPKALQFVTVIVILIVQIAFTRMHTINMRQLSDNVEKMKEAIHHVEPGSLLLTFNYSNNWLDMHSAGYFGSGKPIAVLDNYEANLAWFPINWNMEGPYELAPINVWAADNRKMVRHYYTSPENPDIFSLPMKNNQVQEIPYAVIFGKVTDKADKDYQQMKSVLDNSYTLIFENSFCELYQLK